MKKRIELLRRALVAVSISVSLYYMIWRLGTVNEDAMLFSVILYGAELYGFVASLMFFYMVWKFADRKPKPAPKGLRVDVFIPTLNESEEVLRRTIQGAIDMNYPHKTYVLDNGNRPEIRRLCEELGCEYIARVDNRNGKAGNLNNALSKTDGDFIAVFDADHVPEPDFLDKTLGYFDDERVAFVQTPQDFYNIDSYQHRMVKGKLWTEQSLFFRVIMRGKDRSNSAFFCGSCAVIRRKALESIGGFATGTVTEDLHTSIRLHSKGWKSVYHPETLAYGVAPPTYAPFKTQRERWGQGAMQVFLKDNPLFIRGLTLPQRINYFASMTTYFDGFQKAIFYISPVIVLFTGIFPISISLKEFLPVFIPHILLSIWAFEEMSRGYGKFIILEQYNMARFFSFMKSILGFFKFKKLRFKVTDKENGNKVRLSEIVPQALILAGSVLGIGYAVIRLGELPNRDMYIANIFWALLNTGVASSCILWTLRKKHKRKNFRFPVNFPAMVRVNGISTAVSVEDLHEGGASLISPTDFERGQDIELNLIPQDTDLIVKGIVLYAKRIEELALNRIGVRFYELDDEKKRKITALNFKFFLKKYMEDHDKPFHTPLSFAILLLTGEYFKRRSRRLEIHIPGLIFSHGEFIPYTTEDIGEWGIRILTYKKIPGEYISINFGGSDKYEVTTGKIVWAKEINFYGVKAFRYGIQFGKERTSKPQKEDLYATA